VRQGGRIPGARALLFERLADDEPRRRAAVEDEPLAVLDRAALRRSVRRELERLLNTRCTLPAMDRRARTTLEYGIPDFSHMQTRDTGVREQIADSVRRAVEAYEPRLRQVRVSVEPSPADDQERRLTVRVEAMLVVGDVAEPVAFVRLDLGGGG
jgi:type VI secretion system lysozyme-like protein